MTKPGKKILVGGQALRELGSDRYTEDLDYLIYDTSVNSDFLTSDDIDYINCAHRKFFQEIWASVEVDENGVADPQSLFDLKFFAAVQHFQNFNMAKAAAAEYDLKFLSRNFGCKPKIISRHVAKGELNSVEWQ